MAQYARSRVLRNPTVGQLVRYFRRSKGGVGGGPDRGLGGKMVLISLARVLAVTSCSGVVSPRRLFDKSGPGAFGGLFATGYHIV